MIQEELLSAWLRMSSAIRNDRVVTRMSYHEMHVCNLISKSEEKGAKPMTATDLCEQMGVLKSQMNKVLTGLEDKGILVRRKSKEDKRCIYLTLSEEGEHVYQEEHQHILWVVDNLIKKIGKKDTEETIRLVNMITEYVTGILEDAEKKDK